MILGLTGPQRSGKNEVCSILADRYNFKVISIGAEIKRVVDSLCGRHFTEEEKDQYLPELNNKRPRDAQIYVGNFDEFDHGVWVRKMFANQFEVGRRHVIESVGKPFQWYHILDYASRYNIPARLADVQRPGYEYKDNRGPVEDRLPVLSILNPCTPDWKQRLVDEIEAVYPLMMSPPARQWDLDRQWIKERYGKGL